MGPLTIDDVRAAARRLAGRITRTPVLAAESLDQRSHLRLFFKCENLQRAGAFKIRGALNRLLMLTPDERQRGVLAFSCSLLHEVRPVVKGRRYCVVTFLYGRNAP